VVTFFFFDAFLTFFFLTFWIVESLKKQKVRFWFWFVEVEHLKLGFWNIWNLFFFVGTFENRFFSTFETRFLLEHLKLDFCWNIWNYQKFIRPSCVLTSARKSLHICDPLVLLKKTSNKMLTWKFCFNLYLKCYLKLSFLATNILFTNFIFNYYHFYFTQFRLLS
jgi:hypothetical protein